MLENAIKMQINDEKIDHTLEQDWKNALLLPHKMDAFLLQQWSWEEESSNKERTLHWWSRMCNLYKIDDDWQWLLQKTQVLSFCYISVTIAYPQPTYI